MSGDPATALEAAVRRIAALEAEVSRLNEAAQRAARAKDEFLATLSHELRTPLNAMFGWLHLLRMRDDDPVERARAIDVIERNLRTQAQIIADLLDMSRIITGRMRVGRRRVNLPKTVRRGIEPLEPAAAAKDVALAVELAPVHGAIFGDAARLQQVVWNLVSNAVKFTRPGGRVTIVLCEHADDVELSVHDTGVGIPADALPYVFDRFSQVDSSLTRPHGGLGLGLAIVRHLVELHGGSVAAASSSAHGTTFTVRLPVRASPSP